jgi:hypothetical protein
MNTARFLGVCIVLLAGTGSAGGKTLHVGGTAAYASIQDAVNAAASGDKIVVAPGTYEEAVDIQGKALWLCSRDGPAATLIDGTGQEYAVHCIRAEGPGVILEGFTITGGEVQSWSSTLTVVRCLFRGAGSGVENAGGNATVTNCAFEGSRLFSYFASLTAKGCTFDSASGNALINAPGTYVAVTDCTFTDSGYAGMVNGSESTVAVSRCTFTGNGVGMWNDDSDVAVSDCRFSDNWAGGMMNLAFTTGTVEDCAFFDNGGYGMYNFESGPTVTRCTLIGNAGGGMYTESYFGPVVVNCAFFNNTGIGMHNLYTRGGRQPVVTHCTFVENSDGGIYNDYSTPIVTNSILWANGGFQIGGDPGVVTWSCIQGGWDGQGNIGAGEIDPLFANPGTGDYHLAPGSPCIDAGTNDPAPGLPATDLEGNARCIDGDGDKVKVADMGAYEAPRSKPSGGTPR